MALSGRPLRLPLRLAGAAAAVVVFFAAGALRPRPPSLGLTPGDVVSAWNAEAPTGLRIGELKWTETETGTFGFAFTPAVSLVGRTSGPEVVELVVVGDRSDGDLVAGAAEVLVAVVSPEATNPGEVLRELGLGSGYVPPRVDGVVVLGGVRLRSTSTTDRLGVGAFPAS